jgi:hypothetical protein
MPPFADSILGVDSDFRHAMFRKGVAFRLISQVQFVQNTLDGPVPADQQVYVGQRAFESAMVQPILTADLRQLHLRNAELYLGGVWNWVSWNPAGPRSFQLWDLYLYKSFGEDRLEIKAGYISMNLDFIGLFVGGSTATGTQGVYAVLPNETGMSYFPLTTPAASYELEDRSIPISSLEHNGALILREVRPRSHATTPASDSLRTATNCSSSMKQATCAKRAKTHIKCGFGEAICTTRPPGHSAKRVWQLLRVSFGGLSAAKVKSRTPEPGSLRRCILDDSAGFAESVFSILRSKAL